MTVQDERLRPAPHAGARILLVEDDDGIREALAELLVHKGYEVVPVRHGESALDYLRSGPRPDLILLDLVMPVMDGWTFQTHQLENPDWASIPVLVISAVPWDEHPRPVLKAVAFFPKPLHLRLLMEVIADCCHPNRSTATHRACREMPPSPCEAA